MTTLNDELQGVDTLIAVGQQAVTQHLARVAGVRCVNYAMIETYLNTTLSVATSTLKVCRTIVAECEEAGVHGRGNATQRVRALVAGVFASIRDMHLVMSVVEQLLGKVDEQYSCVPTVHTQQGRSDDSRRCSFCGGTDDKNVRIVAGAEGNICESCTRLACGVLGIPLQE